MSVEKRGKVWRVRWRDASGRHRSATLGPRRQDAVVFEQEMKRAARLGGVAGPDIGLVSLEEFGRIWWRRHIRKLAPSTQQTYADLWDKHVLPYLGGYRLREIRVATIEDWLTDLDAANAGTEQQRKALTGPDPLSWHLASFRSGLRPQRSSVHESGSGPTRSCGRPFGDAPVFPGCNGEAWTKRGYAKWRHRVFKEAAPQGVTPYGLRHTFVSLLIREGRSVVDVAAQAGHSPKVCLDNYAHLFAELAGSGSAEDAIRTVRASGTAKLADTAEGAVEAHVPKVYPS